MALTASSVAASSSLTLLCTLCSSSVYFTTSLTRSDSFDIHWLCTAARRSAWPLKAASMGEKVPHCPAPPPERLSCLTTLRWAFEASSCALASSLR